MNITFCVKGIATHPIGGHKVIYELANRLAQRGHIITLVVPSEDNLYQLPLLNSGGRVFLSKLLFKLGILPNWFKFDNKVNVKIVNGFEEKNFPNADYIVATAYETAKPVAKLPLFKGKKVYLIQDFENWEASDADVIDTYRLGMKNIAISKWLQLLVQKYDENKTLYLPNAINTDIFKITSPVEKRDPQTIGLLYHLGSHKGLKYSFKALNIVKSKFPNINVVMFGAPKKPTNLPDWYTYYRKVNSSSMPKIYNKCGIFLCGTINEGFGLTGAESMACGCALVSTNYKGVREYAINGSNSLLSPIKDYQSLANNIITLISDDKLRINIAKQGASDIENMDWDNTVNKFEKIIV
ncbi:glycosyltransferase family 4 protein [Limosilactobacillus reuteri]|uniref:glycosyltransferase family 4 protein n=1 Tax=Limosilactobacillus reuteri TaxID=1598 RepID=UPI000B30B22B|nr:glycosyltransferase family 4 protein [Limosilactobacillus reuteri]